MVNEIWKDIVGFEDLYQISNYGRVRSLDHIVKCGNRYRHHKGKILKQHKDQKGYMNIRIGKSRKDKYSFRVHRLVANAFIPNPNNYSQVNHIDCNKENNYVENLEWCTNSQNQIHAAINGLNNHYKYDCGRKKIPVVQIKDGIIIAMYNSYKEANRITGIEWKNIKKVCNGERKHACGYQWMRKTDNMKVGDIVNE